MDEGAGVACATLGSTALLLVSKESAMSTSAVRAVLWDADSVLQSTPAYSWDLAVQVVAQIPDALIGAEVNEDSIRAIASRLGLGDRAAGTWISASFRPSCSSSTTSRGTSPPLDRLD